MWSAILACIALVEALPIPQDDPNSEVSSLEVGNASKEDPGLGSRFEGSQLGLALALSDAKPQPVSASSYGGRRKRRESQLVQEEEELLDEAQSNPSVAPEVLDARNEYLRTRFEGSSLGLALALSNAKPQPISESSYGGKKKRSAPGDLVVGAKAEEGQDKKLQPFELDSSNTKPQPVFQSEDAGKTKRSPQDSEQIEDAEPAIQSEIQEGDAEKSSGQSQLALALAISNAKPQPVGESSYAGRK